VLRRKPLQRRDFDATRAARAQRSTRA